MRKQIGSRGRQRIEERLNWDVEKKELLKAYQAALEPNRRAGVTTILNPPAPDSTPEDRDPIALNSSPKMKKYVVITPARDEEEFIEKTILAVVQQTVRPVQWVIVNDGSRDNTGPIIDAYAQQYPWIRLCTARIADFVKRRSNRYLL